MSTQSTKKSSRKAGTVSKQERRTSIPEVMTL